MSIEKNYLKKKWYKEWKKNPRTKERRELAKETRHLPTIVDRIQLLKPKGISKGTEQIMNGSFPPEWVWMSKKSFCDYNEIGLFVDDDDDDGDAVIAFVIVVIVVLNLVFFSSVQSMYTLLTINWIKSYQLIADLSI